MNHTRHSMRHFALHTTWIALFIFTLIPYAPPARPTNTITVNSILDTTGDPGICTLRDAINAANTNAVAGGCAAGSPYPTLDIISISQSRAYCLINPCTFILSSPLPTISEDVTITGVTGALKWTPTISGNNLYRVFDLGAVVVNISNINIINGSATGSCPACYGGAINTSPSDTTLTVSNVTFSGNHASVRGGAIYQPHGTIVIGNSRFINNTSGNYGGAIDQVGGVLIVTQSTLSGNTADSDGGGLEIQSASDTRLTNVTFSGNSAKGNGGGISRIGTSYLLSLNNVTISNNTADNDNNGSGEGGGFYRGGGGVAIGNSIIAGNFDTPNNAGMGTIIPDCDWTFGGSLTSRGYNLIGRGDNCTDFVNGVNGDQVGSNASPLNARLGSLVSNGGSSQTQALLPGSPAIDAGNPLTPGGGGYSACDALDQRGVSRPIGTQCDMGAYEAPTYPKIFLPLVKKSIN